MRTPSRVAGAIVDGEDKLTDEALEYLNQCAAGSGLMNIRWDGPDRGWRNSQRCTAGRTQTELYMEGARRRDLSSARGKFIK